MSSSEIPAQRNSGSGEAPGRVQLVAVVNAACTGCETCVDFCPVDCIDEAPSSGAAPVRIEIEECIGCQVCAKVCEELDWHAIEMVAVDEFARRFGVCPGESSSLPPAS